MIGTNAQRSPQPAETAAIRSQAEAVGSEATRVYGLLLVLVLLMAAAVRFYGLGAQDYWFDELYSLSFSAGKKAEFASLPFGEIIDRFDMTTDVDESTSVRTIARAMREVDTHPPVYFVLLWRWRLLVGESEFAVRSLSAGISFLSVVVLWGIFAALGRPRAGMFAGAINALAYSHVFIGQQNRHYSLSVLFSSVSLWLLVVFERDWRRRAGDWPRLVFLVIAVGYACAVYLALLTHYFSGLALAGLAAYAMIRLRGRALVVWISATAVAGFGAAATWLPAFFDQIDVIKAQRWLIDPVKNHTEITVMRFLDLPVRLLMWADVTTPNWGRALVGVTMAATVSYILIRRRERQALLFALWFLVPAMFFFLVDALSDKQTLFPLRYGVIATPGLIGLVALAIDALGRPPRAFVADQPQALPSEGGGRGGLPVPLMALGGLLVVMALTLPLPAIDHAHARGAVQLLREKAGKDDLIVYDAVGWPPDWVPQFFSPMAYYGQDLTNPVLLLRDPMSDELRAKVADFERVFVVSPRIDAVPHPSPQTHELAGKSRYIHQIGWIYLFVKIS